MAKATHSAPALLILALLAASCSSGPPPSCGAEIGGTADTATFDQYFNTMALVSQETGQPGEDSDKGAKFGQDEPIQIQVDAKAEVPVRACVQPLSGQGEIAYDRTDTIGQGERSLDLGPFEPGSYVVRVIVDGTLVKNFPFQIE